jgi:hypothetical protein
VGATKASTQLWILSAVRVVVSFFAPLVVCTWVIEHRRGLAVPIALAGFMAVFMLAMLFGRRLDGRWASRLLRRRSAQLRAVWSDPVRRRAVLDEIAGLYQTLGAFPDVWLHMRIGQSLIEEQRWAEARVELQLIGPGDYRSLNEWFTVEGWLVLALAQDGQAGAAVERGQQLLERAVAHEAEQKVPGLWYGVRAMVGVALVLDRRHGAALALLRPAVEAAVEAGADAHDLAVWRYHLGLALAAQGSAGEAQAVWEALCSAAPASPWAARAGEQLAAMTSAYR